MLTATYSLVALSVEQKNARNMLSRLHAQIRNILQNLHSINHACLESAITKLEQFEEYCRKRKVETYVIPAIRQSTRKADPILAELETLSSRSIGILRALHEQWRNAIEQGMAGVKNICSGMEMYCHHLYERFAKEEEQLFPVVISLLPNEQWFDIAAKFLHEDDEREKHRPHVDTWVVRKYDIQRGLTA
jgi:hemerythrin-like domain-containing protein